MRPTHPVLSALLSIFGAPPLVLVPPELGKLRATSNSGTIKGKFHDHVTIDYIPTSLPPFKQAYRNQPRKTVPARNPLIPSSMLPKGDGRKHAPGGGNQRQVRKNRRRAFAAGDGKAFH